MTTNADILFSAKLNILRTQKDLILMYNKVDHALFLELRELVKSLDCALTDLEMVR